MKKGPTIIIGDMNARIQIKNSSTEECIGEHTFYKQYTNLEEQIEGVAHSRQLLIEFCTKNNCKIMNTMFKKKQI